MTTPDPRLAALLADPNVDEAIDNLTAKASELSRAEDRAHADDDDADYRSRLHREIALSKESVVAALLSALDRSAPETPEAVREEAAKALVVSRGDGFPSEYDAALPEALQDVDTIAPILRAADQREIARLTEVNADLLSKIGPASYGFKDGIYNICLGYHPTEDVWEWLEVVDKAEVARLTARLAEVEGDLREALGPVRGMWECDKCHFIWQKQIINPITGATGAPSVVETPLCPNDGEAMRSRTWRDLCIDARACADPFAKRMVAAEDALRDVIGVWDSLDDVPSTEPAEPHKERMDTAIESARAALSLEAPRE